MYADNEKKIKESHPVYLLCGTEGYLIRQYTNQIMEAHMPREEWDINLHILEEMPSYAVLAEAVNSVPFFGGRYGVLVRDAGWLQAGRGSAADEERIAELMANIPEDCRLVLIVQGKADGRKKVTKAVKKYGTVIECDPLKSKEIVPWLQRRLKELDLRLGGDAMQYFLSVLNLMSEISLDFVEQELKKAALYTDKKMIDRKTLTESMAAVPEASVFLLLEALSDKQTAKVMTLLKQQEESGTPLIRTAMLLARQVRMLWQARSVDADGGRVDDVMRECGVRYSFVAEKLLRQSRNFPHRALRQAMEDLADAEQMLKSGRTDGAVLEEIVLKLCMADRR
ncbi:MAG: DNA polymerase III subunit delta [Selenomonadales bacterium]|nr:DNA polymerase III subunit delta [Selenomonadales bacterium]